MSREVILVSIGLGVATVASASTWQKLSPSSTGGPKWVPIEVSNGGAGTWRKLIPPVSGYCHAQYSFYRHENVEFYTKYEGGVYSTRIYMSDDTAYRFYDSGWLTGSSVNLGVSGNTFPYANAWLSYSGLMFSAGTVDTSGAYGYTTINCSGTMS